MLETDLIKENQWSKNYTVNKDSFLNDGPPNLSEINVFTDGSKTDDHVGSGYVIYKHQTELNNNSIRLQEDVTVYQAEVYAIKQAATCLLNLGIKFKYVKFYSDSQAALLSLSSWKIKSKLVLDTVNILNALGNICIRLELGWIKAHNNYLGNERADELARNAVYNNIVDFSVDPPHSYFKKSLWEAIYKLWTNRWQDNNSCRMTKIFYPNTHKGKSRYLLGLSRGKSRKFIEMITGQNDLYYIQNKVDYAELLCRFCEEDQETFDHVALECPCFFHSRRELHEIASWKGTHKWKISQIFQIASWPGVKKALFPHSNDSDSDESL